MICNGGMDFSLPAHNLGHEQTRAVFIRIYGKERYCTVPGAVATGSMAPGRYRSRYRTAPQLG
jgi:hypothetical protein